MNSIEEVVPIRLTYDMQSLMNKTDLVRAVHPYSCTDQPQGLAFPQGVVLLVAERSDDGWCKGYAAGNQGWFPATYVQSLPMENIIKVGIWASNRLAFNGPYTVVDKRELKSSMTVFSCTFSFLRLFC